MAVITDNQINLFSLKKILKEANSVLKDIRVPNYSMAFSFCIPEDTIPRLAKDLKNQFDNEDEIGIFDGASSSSSITIDYPEQLFHSQAVESLQNQLTRLNTMRAYNANVSMFETQEFVMFKYQIESKIDNIFKQMKSVKENNVSTSVSIDAYCKTDDGKLHQMGNQFQLNLNVCLYQL